MAINFAPPYIFKRNPIRSQILNKLQKLEDALLKLLKHMLTAADRGDMDHRGDRRDRGEMHDMGDMVDRVT